MCVIHGLYLHFFKNLFILLLTIYHLYNKNDLFNMGSNINKYFYPFC